jgi:transcriptional regulator with XRE-family HTH domain
MPDSLGERIKQARRVRGAAEARDVTQTEVAEALGVTPITVTRWESDARAPSLDAIERLADLLQVSVAWLAFGRGKPSDTKGEGGDAATINRPLGPTARELEPPAEKPGRRRGA